jgi:hypothetical protein
LPASVSPWNSFRGPIDGEKVGDKRYIQYQGCQPPQLDSTN